MSVRYTGDDFNGVTVTDDADLWVTLEGQTVANSSLAFSFEDFTFNSYLVQGTVLAEIRAISSGQSSSFSHVVISETGSVYGGDDGVYLRGDHNRIANDGSIGGKNDAIDVAGEFTEIINRGSVSGFNNGLYVRGESADITNHGIVDGGFKGIDLLGDKHYLANMGSISGNLGVSVNGEANVIANSGFINGVQIHSESGDAANVINNFGTIGESLLAPVAGAVSGGLGTDHITNSGFIGGDVSLEGGDDWLDTRLGEIAGAILAGSGADTVLGSDGEDDISGGDNGDYLKGRLGDDVISGGQGSDVIRGGLGDDRLSGDGNGDGLYAGRGDDTLDGGKGADRLNGGRGDDELTGGSGADVFVFKLDAGDDVITDFEDGNDRIDLSAFGVAFGAVDAATTALGGDAVIDFDALGGEGSLVVTGAAGDLDAADFLL